MKRWILAVVLAIALAAMAQRTMVVVASPCASLTPDNWFLWWLYDCNGPSPTGAGGGGSGAGD